MLYTTHQHKGSTFYMDADEYCTLIVDHNKGEFVTLANLKHTMALHRFHRYMIESLGITHYHDNTMQDYMTRTSDKKLKAQGLKKI